MTRRVILLTGPPGAGKTTAAAEAAGRYGLTSYDRDLGGWREADYLEALAAIGQDPEARAVVVRSAASAADRAEAARLVGATEIYRLDAPEDVLTERLVARGGDIGHRLGALRGYLLRADDKDGVTTFPGWDTIEKEIGRMTDTTNPDGAPADDATTPDGAAGGQPSPGGGNPNGGGDDNTTFTREYVTGLRNEAKTNRLAASEAAEALAELRGQLWAERVAATGRLVNPAELPAPEDLTPEAMTAEAIGAAIDTLLESKPYLGVRGLPNIGQHSAAGEDPGEVSLSGLLRSGA